MIDVGQAVILAAVMDLGIAMANHDTVKTIHGLVYAGSSDSLKAFALAFGGAKLGTGIKTSISALSASTTNQKLKVLADEALIDHATDPE